RPSAGTCSGPDASEGGIIMTAPQQPENGAGDTGDEPTARIEPASQQAPAEPVLAPESAAEETTRIELPPESAAEETTRIELPPESAAEETTRIVLPEDVAQPADGEVTTQLAPAAAEGERATAEGPFGDGILGDDGGRTTRLPGVPKPARK